MNPSIEYVRNTVALITDLDRSYGANIKNLTKSNFTIGLLRLLKNHRDDPENKGIIEYACNNLNVNI